MDKCSIKNWTLVIGFSLRRMTKTMIRKLPTKVKIMIEARTYNFVDVPSFPSAISSFDSSVEFMLKYRKIQGYRKPMKSAEKLNSYPDWILLRSNMVNKTCKAFKGWNRSLENVLVRTRYMCSKSHGNETHLESRFLKIGCRPKWLCRPLYKKSVTIAHSSNSPWSPTATDKPFRRSLATWFGPDIPKFSIFFSSFRSFILLIGFYYRAQIVQICWLGP